MVKDTKYFNWYNSTVNWQLGNQSSHSHALCSSIQTYASVIIFKDFPTSALHIEQWGCCAVPVFIIIAVIITKLTATLVTVVGWLVFILDWDIDHNYASLFLRTIINHHLILPCFNWALMFRYSYFFDSIHIFIYPCTLHLSDSKSGKK